MKILTFNRHESYLNTLAATGHDFDVITQMGETKLSWNKSARPVPSNMKLLNFDNDVKRKLKEGYYDVVICHTLKDLMRFFFSRGKNFVFVIHISLFFNSLPLCLKSFLKRMCLKIFSLVHNLEVVAISEFRLKLWNVEGIVINNAPETIAWDGQRDWSQPIVVGNLIKERGEELGYDLIMKIRQKLHLSIIGNNPQIRDAEHPKDYSEFQKLFSKAGIYVYTIEFPFGDGYNLAMLEAMKIGMAVVTIKNPSSPIEHGVNGMVGSNAEEMVVHIQTLQRDPALVQKLGEAAKRTIEEKFSKKLFVASWNKVLKKAVE